MTTTHLQHVLFDFFGTLVTYRDGAGGNPLTRSLEFLADLGAALDADAFASHWDDAWRDLETEAGRTLRELHMHEGVERFLRALPVSDAERHVEPFTALFIEDWCGGVAGIAGLDAMLARLPVPASVVSNTYYPPLVPGQLERLGMAERFRHVHTSIDHGWRKPHPSIYALARETARCRPDETLFVGDNPECDYHGPRRDGMHAVLIAPAPVPGVPETDRIESVLHLEPWLQQRFGM